MFAAVGVLGLAAGIQGVVTEHPATTYVVSGTIAAYKEHSGKGAYRDLFLTDSSQTYALDYRDHYSPPVPYLGDYVGSQVDLYVNSDTSGGVIALRLREQLYGADYYVNPSDQTRDMVISGALIVAISAAILVWAVRWQTQARRSVETRVRSYAASRSKVTSIKGL